MHRLDKDTSGLLLVARTITSHKTLVASLERRTIRRTYQAVSHGVLTGGGTVDAAVGRHPRERTKMAVVERGRAAVTHYRVLARFRAHTHCEVELQTGRTHQIRVHMAHIRAPLVGDPVYGGRARQPAARARSCAVCCELQAPGAACDAPRLAASRERRAACVRERARPRSARADRRAARGRGRRAMSVRFGFAPDWPAPSAVRAWVTERAGGVSAGTLRFVEPRDARRGFAA